MYECQTKVLWYQHNKLNTFHIAWYGTWDTSLLIYAQAKSVSKCAKFYYINHFQLLCFPCQKRGNRVIGWVNFYPFYEGAYKLSHSYSPHKSLSMSTSMAINIYLG